MYKNNGLYTHKKEREIITVCAMDWAMWWSDIFEVKLREEKKIGFC